MHWLRLVVFNIIPLLLALVSPMLLLWAWGNGLALLPAIMVGLLFLAAALAIFLLGALSQPQMAEQHDALWMELEKLREQVQRLMASSIAGDMETKTSDNSAITDREAKQEQVARHDAQVQQSAPSTAPQQSDTQGASAPATFALPPQTQNASESLPPALQGFKLYMEPVAELASGCRELYRAMPALPAQDGRFFLGRHAQLRARALGMAGTVQAVLLRECLQFIRALHSRGGAVPVICPLDVAVLAQQQTANRLLSLLQTMGQEVARNLLLFSLPVEELARASRAARQSVLELAGHVRGFVLETGSLPDAQMPLPLPLAVHYMETPAAALATASVLDDADVAQRLQGLRARNIGLIACEVDNEQVLEQIRPLVMLARGRHFGAPRKVQLPQQTTPSGAAVASADALTHAGNDVASRAVAR